MQLELMSGEQVLVDVIRKNVVNLTLRVYPDGAVRVTAPYHVPEKDVRAFAERHIIWLERRLADRVNHDPPGTIRLKGCAFALDVKETQTVRVDASNGRITVSGPTDAARQKALDQWWRARVLEICAEYLQKWYPVMEQKGYAKPEITVRKMKSIWGSCTPKTGRIRFNYYLLCAPLEGIEYVVLHELAHLAYPNHGKRFASFMTEHMPDWKARRDVLNQCAPYIGSF